MIENRIVVIGASAGGVTAVRRLIAGFEAHWPVSVFITIHSGKNRNLMPVILNWDSPLPACFAEQQRSFGRAIYVAPPDRHLIVGRTTMTLSAGPKVNHTRPAIDPMFRSAARNHGPRVIGVLLTGYLHDGVNGLHEIHKNGGVTIVQDPSDAEVAEIPLNALRRLMPKYVLPLAQIPKVIGSEIKEHSPDAEMRSRP